MVTQHLKLFCAPPDLSDWKGIVRKIKHPTNKVRIAICGKYVKLKDAYKSIIEAFVHAGVENDARVEVEWISSEKVAQNGAELYLKGMDGLLVPGGFGDRGIEGKVEAIRYARENNIPFFGICLGMQCAVIEFARSVAELQKAHSYEFSQDTEHPVIHLMADQKGVTDMGATMRLGQYPCVLTPGSRSYEAYGMREISERHRHRYEFNNVYREKLLEAGLRIVGVSPDERLVEIVELEDHPWFVGVQFHPELKSRPTAAHPLFRDFVKAAVKRHEQVEKHTDEVGSEIEK
jgi:CTP synthase